MTQETLPATLEITNEIQQFNGLRGEIDEFTSRAAIVPDVETADGDKEARSIRRDGVKLKNDIKERRLDIFRQVDAFNTGLRTLESELIESVTAAYAPHDEAIKAKEAEATARKEEKRKAKEKAQILRWIQAIRDLPARAAVVDLQQIKGILSRTDEPTEGTYAEFTDVARAAWTSARTAIECIRDQKIELERVAAEQAAQTAEMARQQAEFDARIAKMKADQEAREKADAERLERIKAKEDKIKAMEEKLQQEELDECDNVGAAAVATEGELSTDPVYQYIKSQGTDALDGSLAQASRDQEERDEGPRQEVSEATDKLNEAWQECLKDMESIKGDMSSIVLAVIAGKIRHLRWSDEP